MKKEKTEIELAKIWCLHNNIKIYAVPLTNSKLRIEVNNNGVIIPGTKIYASSGGKTNDEKWWLEVEKVYIAYYKKGLK